ncbi:hypothetical protein [Altererythrobacter rubellus]|jgi:DNA processing protein|uniref:hypothetical protein n=1 Tax=Altererythrobacter rubellus TaxID=2173831 RepID=UPI0032E51129
MESTGSQPALLSQKEAFARIRLLRSSHIGPITYRQLLARFGTAEHSLEALLELEISGQLQRYAGGRVSLGS